MPDETIPECKTEQDEAEWWDSHPEVLTRKLGAGVQSGRALRLSQTSLPGASQTRRFSIPLAEMKRLRELASIRGLQADDYLNLLIHEALDAEEKKLAS